MVLHTFNSTAAWHRFARHVTPGDAVLLLADGVYCAVAGIDLPADTHVLQADIEARGLAGRLAARPVDYAGFVALCCRADKVCSWS